AADTTWLLRPLRQAEIPYALQGSRRFYSRYEVVLAGALLAAMARPFDPVQDGLRFLRDLHARVQGQPLHVALPALLRHEELLLAEGAGFEGAQRLANLERLLQQLL